MRLAGAGRFLQGDGYNIHSDRGVHERKAPRSPGGRKTTGIIETMITGGYDVQLGNSGVGAQVLYLRAPTPRFSVKNEGYRWLASH